MADPSHSMIGATMSQDTEFQTVNREAERLVATISIPPCPVIVMKIVREMGRTEPDYGQIADMIVTDGGLAAAILKTVNAPFFGLSMKATSVHQACVYLGLRNTGLVIGGVLLKRLFPEGDSAGIKEYWRSTLDAAATMTALIPSLQGLDRPQVHTFALFRDCGRAALLLRERKHDVQSTADRAGIGEREQDGPSEKFDFNHAWVGCLLAQSWYLSTDLCNAILHHHEPEKVMPNAGGRVDSTARLVALGLLADRIHAMQTDCAPDPAWESGALLVAAAFDITERDLPGLVASVGNSPERRAAA